MNTCFNMCNAFFWTASTARQIKKEWRDYRLCVIVFVVNIISPKLGPFVSSIISRSTVYMCSALTTWFLIFSHFKKCCFLFQLFNECNIYSGICYIILEVLSKKKISFPQYDIFSVYLNWFIYSLISVPEINMIAAVIKPAVLSS